MPPRTDTVPPPMDGTHARQLRQRKLQKLTPGAPDLPRVRRTSAEVRAEKEKKEAKKEAAGVKTKAAKARVEGVKEALRREQAAEIDPLAEPAKKAGATQVQRKSAPKTKSRGSKSKAKSRTTSSMMEATVSDNMPGMEREAGIPAEEHGSDAMIVDEPEDPTRLDENFQAPADFQDRKSRLMAALQRHQPLSSKSKTSSSVPSGLSLPKATASTIVHKPRGLSKGWFEKEGPTAATSNSQSLQYTLPASPVEVHRPEHPLASKEPQLSTTLIHVKSHAQPVMKAKKKERTSQNALANIPGHLKERYVIDFQPAFIHATITISADPWARLPIDDVQELFSAIFPEVTHEIEFSDIFHSPAKQLASMVRNHIREAGLTAVHRTMENQSPTACQHLAVKAEKYGKEFPFIYRYHEVTDILDRHAEGGEAVRREGPWLSPIICETLVAYYNEVELSLPEPSFGPTTDLEVNAPIGAYALCTVAVQRALRTYSTGEYVATKERFEDFKYGKTTRKIVSLLQAQNYQTWNSIFAQLARIGEDMKKRSKKARGASQVAAEDDSDDELEVLPSNVQA